MLTQTIILKSITQVQSRDYWERANITKLRCDNHYMCMSALYKLAVYLFISLLEKWYLIYLYGSCSCFLQFPQIGFNAADLCSLNEIFVSQNCCTVGLLLCPPLALCWPKNASTGSWLNLSEYRNLTPGCCNRNKASSKNDCTTCTYNNFIALPWSNRLLCTESSLSYESKGFSLSSIFCFSDHFTL